MSKTASSDQLQLNRKDIRGNSSFSKKASKSKRPRRYITKGFQLNPDAAVQFDILKAETGPNSGPELIAEALNLLFKKYQKPTVT